MIYARHLKKSRISLGLTFIGLVAGLMLVGRLWLAAGKSQWRGSHEFSYIEQRGDELTVQTILPEYAKKIDWRISESALVETAFGYGPYQWKNIFALGQIDRRGGLVLTRTSQEVLGLAIKGWRVGRETNLTWLDRLKWWYWVQFKVKDKLTIDLNQDMSWQTTNLINEQVFSQKAAGESLSLSLVSGRQLSRVLVNHGLELVSETEVSPPPEKATLYVKEEQNLSGPTVSWLKMLLPEAEVKVGTREGYWSDLVLEPGKDYN